jgi:hypothetical protein
VYLLKLPRLLKMAACLLREVASLVLFTLRGISIGVSLTLALLCILSQPTLDAVLFDPICHICYELGIGCLVSVG